MDKKIRNIKKYLTYYNTIICIIIIAMIICFCFYWNLPSSKIENLLRNSFVGLLTGLIIAVLGNIKNRILINKDNKIDLYDNLFQSGRKLYYDIYKFDIDEYIDDIKIWSFYCELYEFYNKCNKISSSSFDEIKENIKIIELIESISVKIQYMRNKIEDSQFYKKEQYTNVFQKEIHSYNKSIRRLLDGVQNEREIVSKKKETLQKSIL